MLFNSDLSSNSHIHFDGGMRVVVQDLKVIRGELFNVVYFVLEANGGERSRLSRQLLLQGFHVVQINMAVAYHVNKLSSL